MGDSLKGKVAIVTGSGQGIGRGVAIGLAREGSKIVTNNRKPGSTGTAFLTDDDFKALGPERTAWYKKGIEGVNGDAEQTAAQIKELGGEAVPCYADISRMDEAGKLVQTALDSFGRIDIIANIASGFGICPVEKMTEEIWDRVTLTKPKGYYNVIQHALPHMMKQKWGRIINTTSRAFNGDIIKHVEYCAANAGVVGLTKALAIELWPYGITCNAISPFAMSRASWELQALTEIENKGGTPIWMYGNAGEGMLEFTPGPEYVAPMICYLSTEDAANISGSVFNVGANGVGLYSDPEICKSVTKPAKEPWTVEELKQQLPRSVFAGYRTIATDYH